MIELDALGAILSMQGRDSEDILFPSQRIENVRRGGCPYMGPVFGEVPKKTEWKDVTLPRHGLLRETHEAEVVHVSTDTFGNQNYERSFHSRPGYPWSFTTKVSHREVVEPEGQLSSIHGLMFKRSTVCDTKGLMPLSFGAHPYFIVEKGKYTIHLDRELVEVSKDLTKAQVIPISISSKITFSSGTRIIVITGVHFTEMLLWSDNDRFLCIELVKGFNDTALVRPGQSVYAWYRLDVF